jgi:hypothetical protein
MWAVFRFLVVLFSFLFWAGFREGVLWVELWRECGSEVLLLEPLAIQ